MRNRSLALSALVLFALFVMASAAYAGAPPTTAAPISKVTFENASNPADTLVVNTAYDPHNTFNLNPPTWGAHATAKRSGLKGFWCAGSNPASGTAVYPAGTRGQAVLWVPECYESTIVFYYKEPSVGQSDSLDVPFVVNWSSGGPTDSVAPGGYREPLPTTSAWTQITKTRGAGGPPLSAGWLRFQFVSHPDQVYTGEGASIDDISVTGYSFGPVGNLAAVRTAGALSTVTVSWDKPKGQGSTDPDDRTAYYRVWRQDVATTAWTELTTAEATSEESFVDSGVDVNKQFVYAVVAYDSASNTSIWGKLAKSTPVPVAAPHFLTATGSPLSVLYGGPSVLRVPLVDEVGATMIGQAAEIRLERRIGTTVAQLSVATTESTPGTYSATVASTVNTAYRFKYGTGAYSNWIGVTAAGYVTTPSTPSRVTHNKSFTVKGKANRIPTTTRYVVLKAYQKKGKSWVYRTSVKAKVPAGTGVYSYSAKLKVKYKGSYRIKAMLADSYNPAKSSGYRYFSAR